MRDDSVYLAYSLESIELIEQYATGGQEAFVIDTRTQDAILRRMETLADAAAHLSDDTKMRHPGINWRQIAAFRNVLAHAYPDIRLDQVWEAVESDLHPLKAVVQEELDPR